MPILICITESHLSEYISDDEILIPNYQVYTTDRNAYGGGSVIYTHVMLKSSLLSINVKDCAVGFKLDTSAGLLTSSVFIVRHHWRIMKIGYY